MLDNNRQSVALYQYQLHTVTHISLDMLSRNYSNLCNYCCNCMDKYMDFSDGLTTAENFYFLDIPEYADLHLMLAKYAIKECNQSHELSEVELKFFLAGDDVTKITIEEFENNLQFICQRLIWQKLKQLQEEGNKNVR